MLSRRQLLQAGCRLGAGALIGGAAGCAGPVRTVANRRFLNAPVTKGEGRAVLGFYDRGESLLDICRRLSDQLTDWAWLRKGDSVFVKVACNSPNEHPAVTSPEAVTALVGLLRERGAGTIYVGDQAGVGHVRLTAAGRTSSTREAMAENGLLAAIEGAGARLHSFDDQGYDEGYFAAPPGAATSHWGGALWLPRILQEVDHVINLPRLGTHSLAGITCGAKCAVGWLRDDSRRHLHQQGQSFFELIAEISAAEPLRDKLRLTLTMGRAALLDIGPDFGSVYDFDAVVALGSTELLDHDAVATALLSWLDEEQLSFFDVYSPYPEDVDAFNRQLVRRIWGGEAMRSYRRLVAYEQGKGLAYDRCLSHLALVQGYRPARIAVATEGSVPAPLEAALRAYPEGLFVL